jgi:hypothetical protein
MAVDRAEIGKFGQGQIFWVESMLVLILKARNRCTEARWATRVASPRGLVRYELDRPLLVKNTPMSAEMSVVTAAVRGTVENRLLVD